MPFTPKIVPPAAPDAAEKQRQRIVRMPKPDCMIQCRCGGRSITPELSGAVLRNGKVTGGTKIWLCVFCLAKGDRVVVA